MTNQTELEIAKELIKDADVVLITYGMEEGVFQHAQTCQRWRDAIIGLIGIRNTSKTYIIGLLNKKLTDLNAVLKFYLEKGVIK